jgi:hypothetical protein
MQLLRQGRVVLFAVVIVSNFCAVTASAQDPLLAFSNGPTVGLLSTDGDDVADNCERGYLDFELENASPSALSNVRYSIDGSGAEFYGPFPVVAAPSLAAGEKVAVRSVFRFSSLASVGSTSFVLEVVADETTGDPIIAVRNLEPTEADPSPASSVSYGLELEEDLGAWAVVEGIWSSSVVAGGGNGSLRHIRSSISLDFACDRIRSPLVRIGPASTLSLWTNFDIEPFSDAWYDRASVAIATVSGARHVVFPSSGRPYSVGPTSYSGCNSPDSGWAGTANTWASSGWNAAAFGAVLGAPRWARLELSYATNAAEAHDGFRFDEVTLTNLWIPVPDIQSDLCGPIGIPDPMPFGDGFEVGSVASWSGSVGEK